MIISSKDFASSFIKSGFWASLWKGVLSLWIIFHVFLILVLPNSSSYLGRILPWWAVSYGNSLSLHSNWNFFSPDPAHSMYFHYKVFFQDQNQTDLQEPVEGYLPSYKIDREMSLRHRRELYEMRFMVLKTQRIQKFIAPWLCKKYPGATLLQVEHEIETIAPLDVAAFEKASLQELSHKIEFVNYSFDCQGNFDDVEI